MLAVEKLALSGEGLDVGKVFAQGGFIRPHLDFLDPRIVHQDPALAQDHQLPCRGGVAALARGFVDLAGPLVLVTEQAVYQCGFAHAAGADECD